MPMPYIFINVQDGYNTGAVLPDEIYQAPIILYNVRLIMTRGTYIEK